MGNPSSVELEQTMIAASVIIASEALYSNSFSTRPCQQSENLQGNTAAIVALEAIYKVRVATSEQPRGL